jgi:hypothetical protein
VIGRIDAQQFLHTGPDSGVSKISQHAAQRDARSTLTMALNA